MAEPSLTASSLQEALDSVEKNDPASLLRFVEVLEESLAGENMKPGVRSRTVDDVTEREVFELFGLCNSYSELGWLRSYEIPEIQLEPFAKALVVPREAKQVLISIITIWPPYNESNVRIFISMIIHYVVVQINKQQDPGTSEEILLPVSALLPRSTSSTTPSPIGISHKTSQTTAEAPSLVSLTSYTGLPVSYRTTAINKEETNYSGKIDYGISYSEPSKALKTFFPIAQAKALGKLDNGSWIQLLCYLGMSNHCSSVSLV